MNTSHANQKIYAEEVGINWAWYVRVIDHEDDTVTITGIGRFHISERDKHPKNDGNATLIENLNREIVSIKVGNKMFTVRNVGYIFNYKWCS